MLPPFCSIATAILPNLGLEWYLAWFILSPKRNRGTGDKIPRLRVGLRKEV